MGRDPGGSHHAGHCHAAGMLSLPAHGGLWLRVRGPPLLPPTAPAVRAAPPSGAGGGGESAAVWGWGLKEGGRVWGKGEGVATGIGDLERGWRVCHGHRVSTEDARAQGLQSGCLCCAPTCCCCCQLTFSCRCRSSSAVVWARLCCSPASVPASAAFSSSFSASACTGMRSAGTAGTQHGPPSTHLLLLALGTQHPLIPLLPCRCQLCCQLLLLSCQPSPLHVQLLLQRPKTTPTPFGIAPKSVAPRTISASPSNQHRYPKYAPSRGAMQCCPLPPFPRNSSNTGITPKSDNKLGATQSSRSKIRATPPNQHRSSQSASNPQPAWLPRTASLPHISAPTQMHHHPPKTSTASPNQPYPTAPPRCPPFLSAAA